MKGKLTTTYIDRIRMMSFKNSKSNIKLLFKPMKIRSINSILNKAFSRFSTIFYIGLLVQYLRTIKLKYSQIRMVSALLIMIVLVCSVDVLIAQPPPVLPGIPDQAPVSGGLFLLAAAGGAYAWKKLRNK